MSWITAGVLCMPLAVVVFTTLASYTRKATAAGVLVRDRGLIRVVPAAAGTVLERPVAEGQNVQVGVVLFVLALECPLSGGTAAAAVRHSLDERRRSLAQSAAARQALAGTRVAALDNRLAALHSEMVRLDAQGDLLRQRLALAEREAAEHGAEQRPVVRAPQAGTVSTLLAEPGQCVTPHPRWPRWCRLALCCRLSCTRLPRAHGQPGRPLSRADPDIVAHRPETIATAGRVIALYEGRVAQDLRNVARSGAMQ